MVKNVALISFSIQDNFQILPVEDNWEKGVRKEFKPFSSEIASQVSLVVSSFHLLWRPCVSPFLCVKFDANVGRVIEHLSGVSGGGGEGGQEEGGCVRSSHWGGGCLPQGFLLACSSSSDWEEQHFQLMNPDLENYLNFKSYIWQLSLQEAVKSFHEKPLPTLEKTAMNKYYDFLFYEYDGPLSSFSSCHFNDLYSPGHASSNSPGNRQLVLELQKTKHHPKTSAF